MGFNLAYDKEFCHTVSCLGESGNSLQSEVAQALADFREAVNNYFSHGVDNYRNEYYFIFTFEMVGNDVDDADPSVEAMLQYTSRESDPQDVHIHVCGGANSKYVTSELIIPAYTYFLTKCSKMGFTVHECPHRHYGAPVVAEPNADAIEGDCSSMDRKYWVLAAESPKLNDEFQDCTPKCGCATADSAAKTSVFG